MGAWVKKLTDQSLFTKMFVVMVVSIISVTILTSWVTIQMSQKLFVQTFSITNSKIINQIKTGLDALHYSNINIAISVAQSGGIKNFLTEADTDSLTNFKTNFSMSEQMKRIQSGIGSQNIGISILGMNGRNYVSDVTYWSGSSEELQSSPITQDTWKQPGRMLYSFVQAGTWGSNEHRLVATKALLSSESKEGYGTLYMMTRESDFKKIYASFTSQGNDVMIMNQKGLIVSSNREDLIGTISEELLAGAKQAHESQSQEMTLFNHDVILLADYLPLYDYYLVNVIDKQIALGNMLNRKALFMIGAGIVLTAVLVVYFITRRVTRSLSMLVIKMSNITKKNFLNYMAVTGSYETRELSNAYNYMLDELNDYILQLVETQQEQRKAELAALQQQINPHFLYNTLTSVNILVQQGSKEKATETIHALISLLQNTISNVKDTISVEQELLNLKHYVFINQVRYGNGIKVDYFVSPDCLKSQVPKLMLQPFIENAFFHAFNKKSTGYIYVIITKEGDTLHCEIVDNGDGMDLTETKSEQRTSTSARQLFTGIGIRNVHDRILLLYGEEYGVSITSTLGQGTKIAISLPWRT